MNPLRWFKQSKKECIDEQKYLGHMFIAAILLAVFAAAVGSNDIFALSILIVFLIAFITLSNISEMLSNSS